MEICLASIISFVTYLNFDIRAPLLIPFGIPTQVFFQIQGAK